MAVLDRPNATERFEGKGGLSIFLRSWLPDQAPRAVMAICHGFNSHSGQYAWVAENLVAQGFAVYAPDMRGRGESTGERFYVGDVAEYVSDLGQAIAIAKDRHPGLPVFLLGHSAGGVIACSYALDYQAELAGLICESFAFQVPAPGFALTVIKGLSHIAPHLGVLKLKNEDFSRDPEAVARLNADPLIENETQPALTVAALVRADERLHESFEQITIPVLILHGTEDHATVCKGSEYFFEYAGSSDKTFHPYEGHYHDLLADIGKEQVMGDIVAWLNARL